MFGWRWGGFFSFSSFYAHGDSFSRCDGCVCMFAPGIGAARAPRGRGYPRFFRAASLAVNGRGSERPPRSHGIRKIPHIHGRSGRISPISGQRSILSNLRMCQRIASAGFRPRLPAGNTASGARSGGNSDRPAVTQRKRHIERAIGRASHRGRVVDCVGSSGVPEHPDGLTTRPAQWRLGAIWAHPPDPPEFIEIAI